MHTCHTAKLSDELLRAEAASGVMSYSIHRALAKLKILRETASYKMSHLRFCLADPMGLLGIVHRRILTLLRSSPHFDTRSSFHVHTFLASSNIIVVPATDLLAMSTYFRPSLYAWFSTVQVVPTCDPQLSARKLFPRLLLLLVTILLVLFWLISLPGREGLESHTTPRRIRRIQKNVRYHSRHDL